MTDKLKYYTEKIKEKWLDIKDLEDEVKEFCKNKKFLIAKNIYYSGYQNNLKGRECVLKPFVVNGELLFSCVVYNKKTKQIDIKHTYGYSLDYYKELENDR